MSFLGFTLSRRGRFNSKFSCKD